MTDPGLPLTTGEGNKPDYITRAIVERDKRVEQAEAECGRLREQLAAQQKRAENLEQRGSEFAAMAVESEEVAAGLREQLDAERLTHARIELQAVARVTALTEQLDAARTKLGVAEAYIPSRDFGDYEGDARAALDSFAIQEEPEGSVGVEGPAE